MRRFILILTILVCFFASVPRVCAEWRPALYDLYLDLGNQSLQSNDYTNALEFFEEAQRQFPEGAEALEKINLIKRTQESRTTAPAFIDFPPAQTDKLPAAWEAAPVEERHPVQPEPTQVRPRLPDVIAPRTESAGTAGTKSATAAGIKKSA